ncbi:PTS fructose transporter subunit IIABC [Clavibacter phaseoli]|uniref:PTS fructose transporter subunit IIABC n=1 Tax=Clavibacter phaseoli TaxID=1734031 RepID=UPI000E672B38|nr:fructose-specific PTS transporter subunit EIIC [Clavibacter phaseoli]RIJ57226.1 PTS lactose transporter subunit IIC [Clavibacter phaseoli]UKF30690.1 PTS lactose transporter subunit IIC [Clavibacter phaseoli]UKF36608.1 PTS lactose transporter subunit IIC [Clavibacter phaseoli]
MPSLITNRLVLLDADLGADREHAVRTLAERVVAEGRATDADALFADAWERESKTDTGMGGGLAIPHCRSAAVTEATLVMARPEPAVDFGAPDGPADLVFFIAAPDGADQEHLVLLSRLARSLIKPEFVEALRTATDEDQVVSLVEGALVDEPASSTGAPAAAPAATASAPADAPVLIAVTACPTGIAHTYMAADSLVAAAQRAGVELHVETQGSSSVTPVDPAIIARATAVIFAVDVDVRDRARFAGKPVIQSPVKRGIDQPDQMVAEAVAAAKDPSAPRVPGGASSSAGSEQASPQASQSVGARLKRWLLTGVSYMIPFVAGGGLLIALGFLLGGYRITETASDVVLQNSLANLPAGGLGQYLGAVAFVIGNASMAFLVPALAGYIAYAIADRPGIAPGFVAGSISVIMGAGFLGGLVGGLLAGGIAYAIGRIDVPRWLRGLMPVVIIPLLASIVASGLMIMVLGGPIAALTRGLNDFLSGLTGASAILLGVILGVMMCIDLGGPINKVAYSFAVAGLGAGSITDQTPWEIMAAVMAAGMVPPLALALASTVIDRRLFSPAERENGKAAWLLGAAFISEGAIPFAAVDPLRVIPASIVGGGVTGAMIMGLQVVSQAPHGGVFVLFAMNGTFLGFLASVAVGTVVTAFLVVLLKRFTTKRPEAAAVAPVDQGVPVAA